jgi:NADPH:quinone reductase-like Zn-dependent oxidoreductase
MKAVIQTQYGMPDVLQYGEFATPTPDAGEVLIRVRAASINKADWFTMTGSPFFTRLFTGGMSKPKHPILGADVAGIVEAVGSGVTQFKPGDEVFGDLSECGRSTFAEYAIAQANALVLKPSNVTFEQAAAAPMAAVTAYQALCGLTQVQAGQKVLINGASGGVGMFAVQIAKALGAEVTAVCSTRNLDMVRSLGADHVIDYSREDFTQNGQQYDVILGANGYHPLAHYKRALAPNGVYIASGGTMGQIFQAMLLGSLMARGSGKKLTSLSAKPSAKDLAGVAALMGAGKVVPVIDRCYPLSETAEAMRYYGEVHPSGKIVITVAP